MKKQSCFLMLFLVWADAAFALATVYECEAQGQYRLCAAAGQTEHCQDLQSEGAARAASRLQAEFDAKNRCTLHLTQSLIAGNHTTRTAAERAFLVQPCMILSCKTLQREPSANIKRPDPAQQKIEEEPAAKPRQDPELLLQQAKQKLAERDFEQAYDAASLAQDIAPDRPETYSIIAYLRMLEGDFHGGCHAADKGLKKAPDAEELLLLDLECSLYRRQYAQAVRKASKLHSSQNLGIQTKNALLAWLAQSLQKKDLAPCKDLAGLLQKQPFAAEWNLEFLVLFLSWETTKNHTIAVQLLDFVNKIHQQDPNIAPSLLSSCGGS